MTINSACKQFKGEIENYLQKQHTHFDSKINCVFTTLNIKTQLCRANIIKQDGYHASHILLILIMLPLLKLKTIHMFCQKNWQSWSSSCKDTFYRFKHNTSYRWRYFMCKVNFEIFRHLEIGNIPQKDKDMIIDDTFLSKTGKKIENVSYFFDHNLKRNVLGFCIVTLALLVPDGLLLLDFAYRFGKKRDPESPGEKIGDPRSSSGQRSFEAKNYTKLELALMMIENAVNYGILPGYVIFDSWYAWPAFINAIRKINNTIHVICRLKKNNILYEYNGKEYTLSQLYQKNKKRMVKDNITGLYLCRIKVRQPDFEEDSAIVFAKGYREPEDDTIKGQNKQKKYKWIALLSTNLNLQSSAIIKKYTKRWSIEVCFKECKQLLDLGKDQSNDFNSQVFATTMSMLRYNILSYLNQSQNCSSLGELFEHLADESAVISYAHRMWEFFYGLFQISFSKIFELFEIEDDIHCYIGALSQSLTDLAPFKGCET